MALAAGTKLGPIPPIARRFGRDGEVYRARDSRLDRIVAIKILPASYSADADRLQRFVQEARSAAALNHPNILSIFDIGEQRVLPTLFLNCSKVRLCGSGSGAGRFHRRQLNTRYRWPAVWRRRTRRESCIVT